MIQTVAWFHLFAIKIETKGKTEAYIKAAMKQVPFAASHAMNISLGYAKGMVQSEMDAYIMGGATRFTKQGMKIKYSAKRRLTGEIYFKQDRAYMRQIMYGGVKFAKGSRIPEPIKEGGRLLPPSTKYGNIRRGFQQKVQKGATTGKYFVGTPKNWKVDKNPNYYGLWQRYKGKGGTGRLKLIVSYKRSVRQQRKTFPGPELAEYHYMRKLDMQWPASFKYAMDTA